MQGVVEKVSEPTKNSLPKVLGGRDRYGQMKAKPILASLAPTPEHITALIIRACRCEDICSKSLTWCFLVPFYV